MFCPTHKSMLARKDGKPYCVKCDKFYETGGSLIISEKAQGKEITVIEKIPDILPVTKDVECPNCGAYEATWMLRQTRKSDEAETMFLECVKCRHRWRRY